MAVEATPNQNPQPAGSGRRADILAAAGELFRQQGYHATSMRELARRLNLQGPSLYAHIASKEELLREIVDRAADAFLASADAVDPRLPPPRRMAAFVRGHLRVVENEIATAAVFFHEWTHLGPEARGHVVRRRDAYQERLREIVAAGVETGDFVVADVGLATLLTLSTLNWSYQWLDPDGRLGFDELAAAYTDYVLAALGVNGARKETRDDH